MRRTRIRSRPVSASLLVVLIALPAIAFGRSSPPTARSEGGDHARHDIAADDACLRAALGEAALSLADAIRRAEHLAGGRAVEARYALRPDGLRIDVVVLTEHDRTCVRFDAVTGDRLRPPRAPDEPEATATPSAAQEIRARTGLRFSVLESRIRRRITRTRTPYGFKISSVDRGSPAALAGLRPGDVLLEIEGRPIETLEQLRRRLCAAAPGAALPIRYARLRPDRTILTRRPWQEHAGTISPRRERRGPAPGDRAPGTGR